jgi:soluble lytic murein transglycosylase-like protein
MLIYPADTRAVEGGRNFPRANGAVGGNGFARLLDSAAESGKGPGEAPEKVALAAEILRLEMMRSAVSITDNQSEPSAGAFSNTLKAYLTNNVAGSQKTDTEITEMSPQEVPGVQRNDSLTPPAAESLPATNHSPSAYDPIIRNASRRYGVDEGLIKAVIRQESNFNPTAVSHAGARGLMQLMPGTAAGLGVKDSFNPEQNIMAGTRFLKDMLDRYRGDVDSALAAYNWGPGNLDRSRGAFLPRETREYLVKVKRYYAEYVG